MSSTYPVTPLLSTSTPYTTAVLFPFACFSSSQEKSKEVESALMRASEEENVRNSWGRQTLRWLLVVYVVVIVLFKELFNSMLHALAWSKTQQTCTRWGLTFCGQISLQCIFLFISALLMLFSSVATCGLTLKHDVIINREHHWLPKLYLKTCQKILKN